MNFLMALFDKGPMLRGQEDHGCLHCQFLLGKAGGAEHLSLMSWFEKT
jgi:hypothetical protein